MDLYNVIVSPNALSQLDSYVGYIQYTLMNEIAANRLWEDAVETTHELEKVAGSLRLCTHPKLKELGYHPIAFKHHRYVMLYRIHGTTAYVDAIYHQLQDYENTFSQDL
jgi:plasmid stabilization system protein ParE